MKSLTHAAAMLALIASLLTTACGSVPDPKTTAEAASDARGALLVIRLTDRPDPPALLQVEVAPAGGGPSLTLSARRQQSVPASRADYFVALALAPRQYVLSAVRDGASGPGETGETLASPNLPFEVRSGTPAYLGRLVLAPGSALSGRLEVQDQYDEDTLFFRTSLPALRDLTLPRDLLQVNIAQLPPSGRQLSIDTVDAATAIALPGKARDAFQKYLKSRLPRAFAIHGSDTSRFAYVSGDRAVERALKECGKRAGGASCRLVAVDDIIVSSLGCQADVPGRAPQADACGGRVPAGRSP